MWPAPVWRWGKRLRAHLRFFKLPAVLEARLGDPMLAAAVLDRRLHTGIVVAIDGPSYRMRAQQRRSDAQRRALHPEARP